MRGVGYAGQSAKRMAIASAVGVFPASYFRGFSNSYEKNYSRRHRFPKNGTEKRSRREMKNSSLK
jgi:hypothetical protein